jgi:tRNA-modifying protein YgfZ
MNTAWQEFLVRQPGYRSDGDDFGAPTDELAAARTAAVVVPLLDQGLIAIDGPDAKPFLHALVSNNIQDLEVDGVRFAGLLSPKGRLLASFHAWQRPEGLVLLAAADLQTFLVKKLSMYILRSKVRIGELNDTVALLGLGGPHAASLVTDLAGQAPEPGRLLAFDHGTVVCLSPGRFVLAIASAAVADVWARLQPGARAAGLAAWRWLEIAAGQPRVVAGTQEAFVPQMINMEVPEVAGVSFTKGCYPGQEIVARTQYLGKIKRRMYRVALDAPVAAGTDVFTPESAGQHCGAVVTVAPSPDGGYEALLVVQSSGAEVGEVHVGAADGPVVRFLTLPYTVP